MVRVLLLVVGAALLVACEQEPERKARLDGAKGEVIASGPIACEDPSLRAEARWDRRAFPVPPNSSMWLWGGGALTMDLDDDGLQDILSPTETGLKRYLQTPTGTFVESQDWLGGNTLGTGASAADYDGDGDLDVYVTRYAQANVLLENRGDGHFVEVTARAGVAAGRYRSMSSAWGDMDRDGDLDLFVGNYGWFDESGETETESFGPADPSVLYINEGDGTFRDASELLPEQVQRGYTYVAGWYDLNEDGWLDLYVVNDFGVAQPNVLLWNQEGTLVADEGASGLDLPMTGMGLAVADLNADGVQDLLIPEWNNNRLLLSSDALGMWVDYALDLGLTNASGRGQRVGWGSSLADMDNDGDLDALVAYGAVRYVNERWENPEAQPDGLYVQQPDGSFVEDGVAWGLDDDGVGRGFVVQDLNGDGWLDVFKRDLNGPDTLLIARCGTEAWLEVSLRSDTANTHGVGAVVTLTAGEQRWERRVVAGGMNYGSSTAPRLHFGLGEYEAIDRVSIRWPSGHEQVVSDVATRQRLTIWTDE